MRLKIRGGGGGDGRNPFLQHAQELESKFLYSSRYDQDENEEFESLYKEELMPHPAPPQPKNGLLTPGEVEQERC